MATLNVRMTEEEYKKIEEDAKKYNMSISTYIKFITQNVNIQVKVKSSK
jgi:hypothetical protein